jgi:hypothetical protein
VVSIGRSCLEDKGFSHRARGDERSRRSFGIATRGKRITGIGGTSITNASVTHLARDAVHPTPLARDRRRAGNRRRSLPDDTLRRDAGGGANAG